MAGRCFDGTRWAGWAAGLALVVSALATGGCAIHTQGPIKEVAYDFSDRDFYDRAYAPSPQYLETDPQPIVVGTNVTATVGGAASVEPAARVRPFMRGLRRLGPAGARTPGATIQTSD